MGHATDNFNNLTKGGGFPCWPNNVYVPEPSDMLKIKTIEYEEPPLQVCQLLTKEELEKILKKREADKKVVDGVSFFKYLMKLISTSWAEEAEETEDIAIPGGNKFDNKTDVDHPKTESEAITALIPKEDETKSQYTLQNLEQIAEAGAVSTNKTGLLWRDSGVESYNNGDIVKAEKARKFEKDCLDAEIAIINRAPDGENKTIALANYEKNLAQYNKVGELMKAKKPISKADYRPMTEAEKTAAIITRSAAEATIKKINPNYKVTEIKNNGDEKETKRDVVIAEDATNYKGIPEVEKKKLMAADLEQELIAREIYDLSKEDKEKILKGMMANDRIDYNQLLGKKIKDKRAAKKLMESKLASRMEIASKGNLSKKARDSINQDVKGIQNSLNVSKNERIAAEKKKNKREEELKKKNSFEKLKNKQHKEFARYNNNSGGSSNGSGSGSSSGGGASYTNGTTATVGEQQDKTNTEDSGTKTDPTTNTNDKKENGEQKESGKEAAKNNKDTEAPSKWGKERDGRSPASTPNSFSNLVDDSGTTFGDKMDEMNKSGGSIPGYVASKKKDLKEAIKKTLADLIKMIDELGTQKYFGKGEKIVGYKYKKMKCYDSKYFKMEFAPANLPTIRNLVNEILISAPLSKFCIFDKDAAGYPNRILQMDLISELFLGYEPNLKSHTTVEKDGNSLHDELKNEEVYKIFGNLTLFNDVFHKYLPAAKKAIIDAEKEKREQKIAN